VSNASTEKLNKYLNGTPASTEQTAGMRQRYTLTSFIKEDWRLTLQCSCTLAGLIINLVSICALRQDITLLKEPSQTVHAIGAQFIVK